MNVVGVILAAGLGKRMKASLPKVLHKINGIPMLQYVLNTLYELKPQKTVLVVKPSNEMRGSLVMNSSTGIVYQEESRGTGNALLKAWPALRGYKGTVVVLNGDTPLIMRDTLKKFLAIHKKEKNIISILSFMAQEPDSYGRLLRDGKGNILSIVEEKDTTDLQKNIKEVNSGIYALESEAFPVLKEIKLNALKGEYYLTDIVSIARNKGMKIGAYCIGSENELMGVNTPEELERAQELIRERVVRKWADRGVSFMDRTSVFISTETRIGSETVIYPNVYLEGNTKIGIKCTIYPNVRIYNSIIGDEAIIKDSTLIEDSIVKRRASVGPFARIRPGSEIGKDAKVGNFVEVKKSIIGSGTKANHLTYLGDAKIGNNVNIGAGTITCNYDGYKKHITVIEDNVFVGSDSQFIAPVKISKNAYIGAGSTITKDVPSGALALGRAEQKHIKGWVIKRKLKVKSEQLKIKKNEKK